MEPQNQKAKEHQMEQGDLKFAIIYPPIKTTASGFREI
jgi:hypothetical protein